MSGRFKYSLFFLVLIAASVWLAVFSYPAPKLNIIACNVGQGDAFLVQYKSTQILVDGGPGKSVLDCLSKYMPFWDRRIEVVILTHPQKDHYMGLVGVFQNYKVENFIATPLDASAQEWGVLKSLVGSKGVNVINPNSDMVMRLGLIHLDILWPSSAFLASEGKPPNENRAILSGSASDSALRRVSLYRNGVLGTLTSKKDPNEFSILAILSYKDFNALFTGDIGGPQIDQIISSGKVRDVDYLKVPHHGSKNGLTSKLLEASTPEVAVISAGKNNSYGHPHKEVLDILNSFKIKTVRTDDKGDIELITDGETWFIKSSRDK